MLMNAEERERIGDEEIRQAASHDAEIHAGRAEEGGPPIAEWVFMPHPGPESLKSPQTVLWRVAGDQGRVNGADRGANDPVERHSRFLKGLEYAGLIGAERSPALQDEYCLGAGVRRASARGARRSHSSRIYAIAGHRW